MAADVKKVLKYPLNLKPLFVLGILFGIIGGHRYRRWRQCGKQPPYKFRKQKSG